MHRPQLTRRSDQQWQDTYIIIHKESKEDLRDIMSNPAETYESYMGPSLFAPWAKNLVQSANPTPGERVLDVACGTGIVARRVAVHVESNGKITAAIHGDMKDALREVTEDDRVIIPFHAQIARAERGMT
jgi:ubiquinone/menaquinone biosynthesis C-methylase UbiE